jgi:homogentisate phytyltransferase/homogentisate geranylgeranyltransferase
MGVVRRTAHQVQSATLALFRFSRPHTIVGTVLSLIGLSVIAAAEPGTTFSLQRLAWAVVSALGVNVFIVGLNQITDVQIDRVNKPGLPLAAGEMSRTAAWIAVSAGLVAAVIVGASQGPFLLLAVTLAACIGALYSLEPVRFKRYPFWAGTSIASVRGVIVNLLIFLHFSSVSLGAANVPARIWVLTGFVLGLSLVIAWYKDIPDMAGDRRFGIWTLSARLGAQRVIQLGALLLSACYLAVAVSGLFGLPGVNPWILAASHLCLLAAFWVATIRVDLASPASVRSFYLFVWGLFFAEYVAFPAACLLS